MYVINVHIPCFANRPHGYSSAQIASACNESAQQPSWRGSNRRGVIVWHPDNVFGCEKQAYGRCPDTDCLGEYYSPLRAIRRCTVCPIHVLPEVVGAVCVPHGYSPARLTSACNESLQQPSWRARNRRGVIVWHPDNVFGCEKQAYGLRPDTDCQGEWYSPLRGRCAPHCQCAVNQRWATCKKTSCPRPRCW